MTAASQSRRATGPLGSIISLPPVRTVTLPSGATLAVAEAGKGDSVVLVHGSLCDYRYWQPQIEPLSARYRVLSISLSHYFPTRQENRALPFSWHMHVEQIAEFIESVVGDRAHVIAHSRGAYLAFHLARRYARRVRSVTLADPGGSTEAPDTRESTPAPGHINALRAHAVALIDRGDVDAGLELFVDSVSRPGSWAQSPREFKAMARDNAHTLRAQFAEPIPPFMDDDARRIEVPTLLIGGEKSPAIFHRNLAWLGERMPNVAHMTIAGASHGMNLAHPRAFNRTVLDFLNAHGGGLSRA